MNSQLSTALGFEGRLDPVLTSELNTVTQMFMASFDGARKWNVRRLVTTWQWVKGKVRQHSGNMNSDAPYQERVLRIQVVSGLRDGLENISCVRPIR
jgi:hypothetical protein